MKHFCIFLSLFIVIIAASCNDSGPQLIETDKIILENSSIRDRYRITSNSLISIEGLEEGKLYAFFPEGDESRARATSPLIPTNGGTFLSVASGSEMELTGSDIGLDYGSFRITELEADNGKTIIDESSDKPLFTSSDGERVYEKSYSVNPAEIPDLDPEKTTLLAILNGSGTLSSDYGIITSEGKKEQAKKLTDLSSSNSITIYSQLHIKESKKPISYEIKLVTPVRIEKNIPFTLSSPTVYMVGASADELVLEIDMQGNDFTDYNIANAVPDGRYADTGLRKPYIFPIAVEDGKLIIYIGKAERDILFNFISGTGTAVLRSITAEEKNSIFTISSSTFDITIPAGDNQMVIPFLFSGSTTGATVTLSGDIPDSVAVAVVAGDTRGSGYAERSLREGYTSASFKDYHQLEYGFVKVRGEREENTIRLSISR